MSDMPPPDWKPPSRPGTQPAKPDGSSHESAKPATKGVSGYVATHASTAKSPLIDLTKTPTHETHSTHTAAPTTAAPIIDEAEVSRRIQAQLQSGEDPVESALKSKSVNKGAAAGRLKIAGDGGDALADAQLRAANAGFKLGPLAWAGLVIWLLIGPVRNLLEAPDEAGTMTYVMIALGALFGIAIVFGLSWAAFRLFRRSLTAGNIAFCSLFGVAILGNAVMMMMGGAISELMRTGFSPRTAVAQTNIIEVPSVETPKSSQSEETPVVTDSKTPETAPLVTRTPSRTIDEALASAMAGIQQTLQPLIAEHRAAFDELEKSRDDLSKEGLDRRIAAVRRALAANRALDREYTGAPGKVSDLLKYEGFADKDCTKAVLKEFPDQRIAKTTELRAAQKELCAALEGEARVLLNALGRWTLQPKGDLVFSKSEDLQRYQRMNDAVRTIDERHDRILEEMKKQR
ncbi:MAG: hypothetical protein U0640_05905 [Phycisphaerales bacterium]